MQHLPLAAPLAAAVSLLLTAPFADALQAVDPVRQEAYVKAPNTGVADFFGSSVALSDDTLVVGADREDSSATGVDGNFRDDAAQDSGAAYVYRRSGAGWMLEGYLKPASTDPGDGFGFSVAIDGDTIVVGAQSDDSDSVGVGGDPTNNDASASGAAYVFVRTGSSWQLQAYLKASNAQGFDGFGRSVAISGDTLVVGAAGEDSSATGVDGDETNDDVPDSGAAYVFVRSGSAWTQQAYVKASNPGAADLFGFSVAIDGDTMIVGASNEDSASGGVDGNALSDSATDAGAAYVFVRDGTEWSQQAYLKASAPGSFDRFGYDVAMSGDRVAVGAFMEDSGATGIDGDPFDNSTPTAGAAYVFARSGSTWAQEAYVKASNADVNDSFGTSVSLSGDALLVGAPGESSSASGVNGNASDDSLSGAGAAYLFGRGPSGWVQTAYVKTSTPDATDFSGWDVALSDDLLAVSSWAEDSAATGIDGDEVDDSAGQSGAVFVHAQADSLEAVQLTLSLAAGGTETLALNARAPHADAFYWVFGSATGTAPGIDFGGGVVLPLAVDGYWLLTLKKPFLDAFGGFVGQLDFAGTAIASLTIPAGADPGLAGVTLYHAYLAAPALGGAEFASAPVATQLTP